MSEIETATYVEVDGERFYTGNQCPEERTDVYTTFAQDQTMLSRDELVKLINHPDRFMGRDRWGDDWIYNQGNRGSCNGFAGAQADERSRDLGGQERVQLSGEDLYAQINGGRDQGSSLQRGMEALQRTGVAPRELVPPQTYLDRKISSVAKRNRKRFLCPEPLGVDTELELAQGIAQGMVGVVAVHASGSFSRIDDQGRCGASRGRGNHSVTVDDVVMINDEIAFDMPNSWGLRWGTRGRGFLTWDRHLASTVRYHSFYLLPAVIRDPDGSQPPLPDQWTDPVPPVSDVLIELESSTRCGPCIAWKRDVQPLCEQAGWRVVPITPTGPVPSITIRVGGRQHQFRRGAVSFSSIKQQVTRMVGG